MANDNLMYLALLIGSAVLLYYVFAQSDGMVEGSMDESELIGEEVSRENFTDGSVAESAAPVVHSGSELNGNFNEVGEGTEEFIQPERQVSCYPKDQLKPDELLPQDFSSTWAQNNPGGVGSLEGRNFLKAESFIGIDTVGQTLRNANLQLRSEPPNPQVRVSPFLNSSIGPDTARRYLEIGSC